MLYPKGFLMAPQPDEFDPFQFTDNLPSDFEGVTSDAYFGFDPEYNNGGTLLLHITITPDDPEIEPFVQKYSAGSAEAGWDTVGRGEGAIRNGDDRKTFNKQGAVASIVNAMLEGGGAGILRARFTDGTAPRGPLDAALYNGLRCYWERVETNYGGEIGVRARLVPTKVIGEVGGKAGGAKKAAGGAKKAAGARKAGAAAAAPAKPTVDVAAALEALDAIADRCEEFEEYLELAYAEQADAMAVPEIEALAKDESEEGEGVWARALARAEEG